MTDINRPLSGFRYVEVRVGDTLQAIAARELRDTSRWPDLITINKLVFPYIASDPSRVAAGIVTAGDLLLVPAAQSEATADTDPNAVFGVDVRLTQGRLTVANGDFDIVGGRDNYKQAMENVVETNPGELLYHLDYGCGARKLLGAVNGPTAALLAAEYVKSAVEADPRTQSVTSASATVVGDALPVKATAVPITGAPINLEASL